MFGMVGVYIPCALPQVWLEDTPTGRVPYAFHFSYKVDKEKKEYLVANGDIGVLDVLLAGGTLRSPYYKFVRESLGLPVDHLYEVVDPRHSDEPLLLDLSGSTDVIGAHCEDERSGPGHHDHCVWLLRGVARVSSGSDTQQGRKATLTLGWVEQELPDYWVTNNRMVLLVYQDHRDGPLPNQCTKIIVMGLFQIRLTSSFR